jgi:hypothetical protein
MQTSGGPTVKIETFGRLDGSVFYQITDSAGRVVMLSPEEALGLLAWLDRQKSELARLLRLDTGPDTGAQPQV